MMVGRWFRFYEETLDDPKVQHLDLALFKAWVNFLCLASKFRGKVPPKEVPFGLRASAEEARKIMTALDDAGLLDDDGKGNLVPHNWNGRQFQSDSSTERVKRFRERSKLNSSKRSKKRRETVSGNGPEKESETDTESEKETKNTSSLRSDSSLRSESPLRSESARAKKKPKKNGLETNGAFALPAWIPSEPWLAFVEMRKKIRAPLTDRAIKLAIAELERLKAEGHEPGAVLDQSVLKAWRGLFEIGAKFGSDAGGYKIVSILDDDEEKPSCH